MAEIKDGIYAYVSGTVTRTFSTKNGEACEVEVKGPQDQYGDKVTVWGGDGKVAQGDRVTFKGWYRDRREKYTDGQGVERVAFKRSLNKPDLVAHEPAGGGFDAPTGLGSSGDGFDAQGGFDGDELQPF